MNDQARTVLVVDDETQILDLAEMVLQKRGYKVLTAQQPSQGIDVAANTREEIDLLLADVGLPEMEATELRSRIRAVQPKTRTLFMSGHPGDVLAGKGIDPSRENVVFKPSSLRELVLKVDEALHE